jgi:hypothetical protein
MPIYVIKFYHKSHDLCYETYDSLILNVKHNVSRNLHNLIEEM